MNNVAIAILWSGNNNENDSETEELLVIRVERKYLRERYNVFDMPGKKFCESFRLSKEVFKLVLSEISQYIGIGNNRNHINTGRIPLHLRLAAVLNFLATGSYQRTVGDVMYHSMDQSMISKSIYELTSVMESCLCAKWIKYPDEDEKAKMKKINYEKCKIPGVIGYVDGTHISLIAPTANEHLYVNRKGYHSMNVQLVCNYDLKIYSVCARYPGSTHDSAIWSLSADRRKLESQYNNGEKNTWLLGDAGYPLEPWLITPFKSSCTEDQKHFNYMHSKGRNPIERCNGVLKGAFRCLLGERKLRYAPEKVIKIVNVCCALHNMGIFYKIPFATIESSNSTDTDFNLSDDDDGDDEQDNEREIAFRTRNKIMNSLNVG